jgi:hypothetical protein
MAVPVDPTCRLQIPVGGSVTLRMQPTDFVGPPHIPLSVAEAQCARMAAHAPCNARPDQMLAAAYLARFACVPFLGFDTGQVSPCRSDPVPLPRDRAPRHRHDPASQDRANALRLRRALRAARREARCAAQRSPQCAHERGRRRVGGCRREGRVADSSCPVRQGGAGCSRT